LQPRSRADGDDDGDDDTQKKETVFLIRTDGDANSRGSNITITENKNKNKKKKGHCTTTFPFSPFRLTRRICDPFAPFYSRSIALGTSLEEKKCIEIRPMRDNHRHSQSWADRDPLSATMQDSPVDDDFVVLVAFSPC